MEANVFISLLSGFSIFLFAGVSGFGFSPVFLW